MRGVISLVFVMFLGLAASPGVMACEDYAAFNPDSWDGAVFEAETRQDYPTLAYVMVTDCIAGPCRTGAATILKDPETGGVPELHTGEVRLWTVEAAGTPGVWQVRACTHPVEHYFDRPRETRVIEDAG